MEINIQRVITWVLLVLLAGFIGQFGKSLSTALINKFRKKKEAIVVEPEETWAAPRGKEITSNVAEEVSSCDNKILKKHAKTRFKMMKKAEKKG
jgi:hypothetical protein